MQAGHFRRYEACAGQGEFPAIDSEWLLPIEIPPVLTAAQWVSYKPAESAAITAEVSEAGSGGSPAMTGPVTNVTTPRAVSALAPHRAFTFSGPTRQAMQHFNMRFFTQASPAGIGHGEVIVHTLVTFAGRFIREAFKKYEFIGVICLEKLPDQCFGLIGLHVGCKFGNESYELIPFLRFYPNPHVKSIIHGIIYRF